MISLVILSVIGAAFTRILTYQTRYLAHETSLRTARSVARTANNILLSDFARVQDSGGVDSGVVDRQGSFASWFRTGSGWCAPQTGW